MIFYCVLVMATKRNKDYVHQFVSQRSENPVYTNLAREVARLEREYAEQVIKANFAVTEHRNNVEASVKRYAEHFNLGIQNRLSKLEEDAKKETGKLEAIKRSKEEAIRRLSCTNKYI